MLHARALFDQIRRDLEPIDDRLLQHPYLQSLETGQIGREKLRLFAGEQYAIIASDLRSRALWGNRFGPSASRDFFLGILQGEKAAWDALLAFGSGLGLTEADLNAHEPLAGAHAYTCYMAWLALYASDAEVAAAYLVNFSASGQNCGRLRHILSERFGLAEKERVFSDLSAARTSVCERHPLTIMQQGLDRRTDPRLMGRAARLLQAYELMYWDTLYEASTSR